MVILTQFGAFYVILIYYYRFWLDQKRNHSKLKKSSIRIFTADKLIDWIFNFKQDLESRIFVFVKKFYSYQSAEMPESEIAKRIRMLNMRPISPILTRKVRREPTLSHSYGFISKDKRFSGPLWEFLTKHAIFRVSSWDIYSVKLFKGAQVQWTY